MFLNPSEQGIADYWDDTEVLELYDALLARRIAWKWDAVLDHLDTRGFAWSEGLSGVVDWGCGTGVAARALAHRGWIRPGSDLWFHDRSARAMGFARIAFERAHPTLSPRLNVRLGDPRSSEASSVTADGPHGLLLSHVGNELSPSAWSALLSRVSRADRVIWVEPGTPQCASRLVEAREALRPAFNVVAPCPHQGRCGLAGRTASGDWCHFFAKPPQDIFQDGAWVKAARALGIDLRALPVSYLVLERKDASPSVNRPETRASNGLVIGRPRFYKGHAKMLVCEDAEVTERTLQERAHKGFLKELAKAPFHAYQPPDGDE